MANFQNINKLNENFVAVLIPAFLGYQVHIQFYKVLKKVLLWIYFLYFFEPQKLTDMCRNANTCK